MHGVARSGLNRRARLIVVRVGVADGGDNSCGDSVLNQFARAGNFGRDGHNFHEPVGGIEKFLKNFDRRPGDGIRRMHAAARFADEGPSR